MKKKEEQNEKIKKELKTTKISLKYVNARKKEILLQYLEHKN